VAGNPRLLGLTVVLFLSAAAPALGTTQSCTSGPLIQHWNGTAFTQVASPGNDAPTAVAAASPSDVWSVGAPESGPFSQHWDGSSWQPVTMAPPPAHWNPGAYGASISVEAPTDVWALVGTVTERWDGSSWHRLLVPRKGPLFGIAALSPTNAWAVGTASVPFRAHMRYRPEHTFVIHWNGSVWTRVTSPNPAAANPPGSRNDNVLSGVAAASPRSVWAVGLYFRHVKGGPHSWQTLIVHWDGRRWKRVPSPSPGGLGHPAALSDVAVAGRNDVWAVGGYGIGNNVTRVLVEHWNGRRWSIVPAPSGYAFSSDQSLGDLSVVSADDIWASGHALTDNGTDIVDLGLVEHWDGNSWTLVPTLHDWNEGDSTSGIAAASSDDVWTVGSWATCS
jgi:hypothetical protein